MNKRDLNLPSAPWPYAVQARVNPKGRTGTFWCVVNLSKGLDVRIGPMVKGVGAHGWAAGWADTLYRQRLTRPYGSQDFTTVKQARLGVMQWQGTLDWEVIR